MKTEPRYLQGKERSAKPKFYQLSSAEGFVPVLQAQ